MTVRRGFPTGWIVHESDQVLSWDVWDRTLESVSSSCAYPAGAPANVKPSTVQNSAIVEKAGIVVPSAQEV
jgi:hypothetical protein